MSRKLIQKKEIWFFGGLLLVCLLCIGLYLFSLDEKRTAIIYVDQQIYKTINLNTAKDQTITINSKGKVATISIENGKIGFIHHQCPDGICESVGMMNSPLNVAVCLPLNISITIEGKDKNMDALAG